MVAINELKQINAFEWEIPKTYRSDMRVPVRIFASEELIREIMRDKSLDQAVNAATLPGLAGKVVVMPDMHQGYGFPIGGVAATLYPGGVVSPGGIGYDINCLAGDSLVMHEHGYTRRIDAMAEDWQGASLACFRFNDPQLDRASPALWFQQSPHTQVFRLVTEAGHEIQATADHPFWTEDGMVPLKRLDVSDRVAVHAFRGVPYIPPSDKQILSRDEIEKYLRELGKSESGNALGQIFNHLERRDLLDLRYSSPAIPYLCKILGYVFGDGNVHFVAKTQKGVVSFYGQLEDLEDIRHDVACLGFKPSQVWSRDRTHQIETTYDEYTFTTTENWFTVNSTSFAALLACLGTPVGQKASQDYELPGWLHSAPLWQKRLFLAALFGAELSTPRAMSGHDKNFTPPLLSMNKRDGYVESGEEFLTEIVEWLSDFNVEARVISSRAEQVNADGSRSIRLRLSIATNSENLYQLWGVIGFEYNRHRRTLASAAVQYLALKMARIHARQEIADEAVLMMESGHAPHEIFDALIGETANRRFVERSLYEGRKTAPRIGDDFLGFDDFFELVTKGNHQSGMVWDRIDSIEAVDYRGLVYDFTLNHPDHNFIANNFVVSNCGVRLLASQIPHQEAKPHLGALASALHQQCPSGVGKGGHLKLSVSETEEVCRDGSEWALKKGYATKADVRRTEDGGRLAGTDPDKISQRAKNRGRSQVGSLGAGNHFIEVDLVAEIFDAEAAQVMGLRKGHLALQIHCGSRGLGHQVCSDYVRTLQGAVHRYGITLPDRELVCAPMDSPEGRDYLAAMRCAANYAFANRQVLAHFARLAFEKVLAGKVKNWHLHQVYDVAHNIGKIESHNVDGIPTKVCVHRKGATRAFGPGAEDLPGEYRSIGQPVLVPGSMGTASWVLRGTEESMKRSWGSSCHGAGRTMSRRQAKKAVWGEDLHAELEASGIHIRTRSMAGLAEEAPRAYKNVNPVVDTITPAGVAKKASPLKPLAVI